jgi:hypothetical protein
VCAFKAGSKDAQRRRSDTAIQWCGDWAVSDWIRSRIRSMTLYCYLVARTYKKWRMRMDDSCLCGEGAETFLHLQLACKLKSRSVETRSARRRNEGKRRSRGRRRLKEGGYLTPGTGPVLTSTLSRGER